MQIRFALVGASLVLVALAGCATDDSSGDTSGTGQGHDPPDRYTHRLAEMIQVHWAPGTLSSIENMGDTDRELLLPFGWMQIEGDPDDPGMFSMVPHEGITLNAGETAWFLPPPRQGNIEIQVDGAFHTLRIADQTDVVPENEVVSGENVWNLSAHQEANFPHRQVNLPGGNYWTAIDYFADYFEDLGMEVEVDPYNTKALTMDGTVCTPDPDLPTDTREPCPGSLANVVATLPGTDPDLPTIFVAGGHFDMVATTTHAAFDDTSGTVATLELARAMSQFEWRHTLKFGLWGGEEDGILGSQFWIQSNPHARTTVTTYWNLDVVGMSWPAPLVDPDPIVIAAGPDAPKGDGGSASGPIAESLLGLAEELQTRWFEYPDEVNGTTMWYYEGVVSGQGAATGSTGDLSGGAVGGYAGVNAASDHTPFMAAGIPAYFIFNGDALANDNPVRLHTERDTLENMTRYAYFGGERTEEILAEEEGLEEPFKWDPEDYATAQQTLAESWEVVMWFPFYSALLQDTGYWYTPGPAGQNAMALDTAASTDP